MEITIALAITILNCVLGVITFATNRNKDAVGEVKEESKEKVVDVADKKLIEYRLEQVEKKLDRILDILDTYDKEIDERVNKALEQHIKLYHEGTKGI